MFIVFTISKVVISSIMLFLIEIIDYFILTKRTNNFKLLYSIIIIAITKQKNNNKERSNLQDIVRVFNLYSKKKNTNLSCNLRKDKSREIFNCLSIIDISREVN